MARLAISGFGQVELNNAAFRRDGRIEAQCAPNASDFSNVTIDTKKCLNKHVFKLQSLQLFVLNKLNLIFFS